MRLLNLFFRNLRPFSEEHFSLDTLTAVMGGNGTGKTTFIEGVSLLCTGKSFRTSDVRETVNQNNSHIYLSASAEDDAGMPRLLTFGFSKDGSKKITLDDAAASRRKILEDFPTVFCTPEDMDMLKGAPKKRRDFLDKASFLEDFSYFDALVQYARFVKHKTTLLRSGKIEALRYLNEAAVPVIEKIRQTRSNTATLINKECVQTAGELGLQMTAEFHVPVYDKTGEHLQEKLEKEKEKGCLLYGPHLDQITVKINTHGSRTNSNGELAAAALLTRIAEIRLHQRACRNPVLLIDEVLSFLDNNNRSMVLSPLSVLGCQVLITGLSGKGLFEEKGFSIISLKNCGNSVS